MTLRAVAQGGGGSSITLQTNGTNNASQSILNLVNGSNITITDGGGGSISIAASAGASTWDAIGAAVGSKTTANGANSIVWNNAQTVDSTVAWTFGETSAATNGTSTSGVPNQVLLKLATLAASTQSPLSVYSRGSHVFSVSPSAAQILGTNGAAANPLYAFAGSVNSGMYMDGVPSLSFALSGSTLLQLRGGAANFPAGSAGSPGIANLTVSTTGFFFPSGTAVGITQGGVELIRFLGSTNTAQVLIKPCTFANLGTPADGSFAFCSDCDAPTLVDSTCTSAGGKTGSFAARVNGAWKCFT